MVHLGLTMALLLLAACAGGQTASPIALDSLHQDRIAVAGRIVPLPPGQWRVLDAATQATVNAEGGSPIVRNVLLVQENAGRLDGLVLVVASEPSTGPLQWLNPGAAPPCQPQSPAGGFAPTVVNIRNVTAFDCRRTLIWSLSSLNLSGAPPGWERFARQRAAQPDWAPGWAVLMMAQQGDSQGFLHLRYSFRSQGPGAGEDAPQPRIGRWSEQAWPAIARGFSGGAAGPLPAF